MAEDLPHFQLTKEAGRKQEPAKIMIAPIHSKPTLLAMVIILGSQVGIKMKRLYRMMKGESILNIFY